MPGPLQGYKVIEMVGIGPGPFCAMMLADMGAEVIRIDKKSVAKNSNAKNSNLDPRFDVLARGRRSLALDLKTPAAIAIVLQLIEQADALIEGFRPGVMERLGLGPKQCHERNPRLVYGRMTGWGQEGPLAQTAGHDLNYIALSGMLHAIGRAEEPPPPPLNLIGDFGGGAMMLAFGIVCALLETKKSNRGQVIDAAMTDGSALLGTLIYGLKASQRWQVQRGANLLDGGAHFYGVYECADGKFISIAALEPQFYAMALKRMGIEDLEFQHPIGSTIDARQWPMLKKKLAEKFKSKSRDQWCEVFAGSDACVTPVLDMDEAPLHAHNRERGTFVNIAGVTQPAPAPRFSRTSADTPKPSSAPGENSAEILLQWGFSERELASLKEAGVL